MTTSPHPGAAPERARRRLGAVAGLASAAVALGISQFVAALTGPGGAVVPAVGAVVVDLAPPPLKNFAIAAFGTHDKAVLAGGVLVALAALAAAAGAVAARRPGYGLTAVAVLGLAGAAAAVSRPGAGAAAALPSLLGAGGAAATLASLVRAIGEAAPPAATPSAPAKARPAPLPGPPWSAGQPLPPGPPVPATGPLPGGLRPGAVPGRRRFLVAGAAALGAAAAGYGGSRLLPGPRVAAARSAVRLPRPARPLPPLPPGTDLHIPGLTAFVTPSASFYRVDTALILPEVTPQRWRLRIWGMVEREVEVSFASLLRRPLTENYITLTCVSNPVGGPFIGNARWLGASLASLLRAARPRAGADQLLCTSADGFTSGTPLEVVMDGRDALLAVAMNGAALPVAHGFPARMVVPGLYGYVSATKWITDIKVTTFAAERAYWVQRGWAQRAPIKTESRIDVPHGQIRAGRTQVAGVAWAQHKGIEAVEVRVDRGAWQQARLAAVPGIDTWRQWVWDWDATPGDHLIEARATDATGYTQTARATPPEPDGATGYPSVRVSAR